MVRIIAPIEQIKDGYRLGLIGGDVGRIHLAYLISLGDKGILSFDSSNR